MEVVTVLVDARNVLRSRWPNIPERELVELCAAWAARAPGRRVVAVFDGAAPGAPADGPCEVVGTGAESADDRLVREAARCRAESRRFWLVTSDREVQARAGAGSGAERTIGGGSFAAELLGE